MKILLPSANTNTAGSAGADAAQSKEHLNNLHGLRFFAAISVFVHHVEQFKQWAGLPNMWDTFLIKNMGDEAVRFFFVLSGFLITLGLLKQQRTTGNINFQAFYKKRILRIWPLYYLVVFVSFFILPHALDFGALNMGGMSDAVQQNFAPLLAYFVFFVPNLAAPPNYAPVLGASQCWSLGVEEQFYLVWPILLSWFASAPLLLFFGVIALKLVVAHAGNFMDGNHIPTAFLWSFSIEAMAAGGIAAYLFLQQKEGKPLAAAVLCALASIIAALVLGYGPLHTAAIVGYAAIIYSATKLPPLGGPFYAPLQFLGKISYGFYMLHATAILICLNLLLLHTDLDHSSSAMNGAIYVSSLILAFIFSVCSYRFFELPFLRLKSSH